MNKPTSMEVFSEYETRELLKLKPPYISKARTSQLRQDSAKLF